MTDASQHTKKSSKLFRVPGIASVCGRARGFLRLLADRILNSLRLELLALKRNLTSICRLHVLAAQELLAPLLARALFLGCTVGWFSMNLQFSITICLSFFTAGWYVVTKGNILSVVPLSFFLRFMAELFFSSFKAAISLHDKLFLGLLILISASCVLTLSK